MSKVLIPILILFVWSCSREPDQGTFILKKNTGIDFENTLKDSDAFNIIQYLYYYNGGGVAAGDLNNDGLVDLYFTANEGPDRLYLNEGNFKFKDITEPAGVLGDQTWSNGVTMADVNDDGLLDIYVCSLGDYRGKKGKNRLYINNGDLTFREAAAEFGLNFVGFATHAAFFDYDRDGDLDVYLLNHAVHSFENYGDATSLRSKRDSLSGDRLMRNEGGKFIDVSSQAGIYGSRIGYGLGLAVGDLNNDNWPDLYISNDFHENDYLYINNGNGTFSEQLEQVIGHTSQFSMGNNIADLNNDGWDDIVSLDMKPADALIYRSSVGEDPYNIYQLKRRFGYYHQSPRNAFQLNRGLGQDTLLFFSEIAHLAGLEATDWSWSPLLEDLDNDGWKDVFITNGIWKRPNDLDYLKYASNQQVQKAATDKELASKMPSGMISNFVFRNTGKLGFENKTKEWGITGAIVSNGGVLADLDNDGDLDLVTNNLNAKAGVFENRIESGNHYLKIQCKGPAGNRFGIGVKVFVETDSLKLDDELYTSKGYLSSGPPELVFGLGKTQTIQSLKAIWPDGKQTIMTDVPINQTIVLQYEKAGLDAAPENQAIAPIQLVDVTEESGVAFIYQENDYNDFEQERLIPRLLSTEGPRIAVADVNADGMEDFYVCGAAGQEGGLFVQQIDGHFSRISGMFTENISLEEVDALFFDADNDDDPDLYLVNGGGAYPENAPDYQDKLYLNDGKGGFIYQPDRLPQIRLNGACVVALDVNDDGALDLFVGSRSVPRSYGLDPQSQVLLNDGKGYFTEATPSYLPDAGRIGMVTDAVLVKESGRSTLVVAGEWMPITLLQVGQGIWTRTSIQNSEGWWNNLKIADLNGDGTLDLIGGNLGLNTPLRASVSAPIGLYVKDFDENLKTDPIITYQSNGKPYPFAATDELINQMAGLKKLLTSYSDFAALTFNDLFPAKIRQGVLEKKAVEFRSVVFLNEGKGNYRMEALSETAQFSPVFGIESMDVNQDGFSDLLLAGNFSGFSPQIGNCDASTGVVMLGDGKGGFNPYESLETRLPLTGEIRDMKQIATKNGPLLLVSRNKGRLSVYKWALFF